MRPISKPDAQRAGRRGVSRGTGMAVAFGGFHFRAPAMNLSADVMPVTFDPSLEREEPSEATTVM